MEHNKQSIMSELEPDAELIGYKVLVMGIYSEPHPEEHVLPYFSEILHEQKFDFMSLSKAHKLKIIKQIISKVKKTCKG